MLQVPDITKCYVCSKEPSKRCTRCLQIAYCGVKCQKSDWKFHKNSCLQKKDNVIDMLIKHGNFDHILRDICSHMSGADLHNFRCVKRSWRDVVLDLQNSKIVKKSWERKLAQQWKHGSPAIRTVVECDSSISKIAISGSELFVDVSGQPVINVYDVTTNKFKYSLPAASGNDSTWDVHKDFLVIFDGSKFYVWDRHQHKREEIGKGAYMQIGTHFSGTTTIDYDLLYNADPNDFDDPNDSDDPDDPDDSDDSNDSAAPMAHHLCMYNGARVQKAQEDRPARIKIFSDENGDDHRESALIVVYKSGIVRRWTYSTPYGVHYDHMGEKGPSPKVFKFVAKEDNDYLMNFHPSPCDILDSNIFLCQPWYDDRCRPHKLSSTLLWFTGDRLDFVQLDGINVDHVPTYMIEEVENVYHYYESSKLSVGVVEEEGWEGYVILKRSFDRVYNDFRMKKQFVERTYTQSVKKSWKKSQIVQDDDNLQYNLNYLEIYTIKHGYKIHRIRLMKMFGLRGACMNDQHMITALAVKGNNIINIYDAKEIIADRKFFDNNDMEYNHNPIPLRRINLGRHNIPDYLYNLLLAGPNWLIWNEDVEHIDGGDKQTQASVKFVNFWME